MACGYQIYPQLNLIAIIYQGEVTVRDVLEMLDCMENDRDFHQGIFEYSDLSRIDRLNISAKDLVLLGSLVLGLYRRHIGPARSAFWAPNDISFRAASIYCSVVSATSTLKTKVARRQEELHDFLQVTSLDFSLAH